MRINEYLAKLKNELGRVPSVGFFGLGVSNIALMNALGDTECDITFRTDGVLPIDILPRGKHTVRGYDGDSALSAICEDVLFVSPSARRESRPELARAAARGVRIMSDAELFFLDEPSNVFAVTGSDGKSTTASIAAALLRAEYPRAALIGNIGTPFACADEDARAYVAELSSFQLRYIKPMSNSCVITSITPNHLDWHKGMREYTETKLALTDRADKVTLPADDPICQTVLKERDVFAIYSQRHTFEELRHEYRAQLYVTLEDGHILANGERLLALSHIKRREWYNIYNLMAAMCLCSGHYTREQLARVAAEFHGLSHRAELFLRSDGRDYIDSSIDTSPSRTAATLSALGIPVSIILGGRGKHIPLGECLMALEKYAVRISLYGDAGVEYFREITESGLDGRTECKLFDRFRDAVDFADGAERGVTVLLSPAATGYGEFKSYVERAEAFRDQIKKRHGG